MCTYLGTKCCIVTLFKIKNHKLTLNLLMTTIVAPPSNASKWQMGFNLALKGLMYTAHYSREMVESSISV